MSNGSIFRTANEAFKYYLTEIKISSQAFDYANTKAIFNQGFTITSPKEFIISIEERNWSLAYARREWEWYKTGNRSVEEMQKHAPIWRRMHGGDNLVWSNYGWWWKLGHQLEEVTNMLKKDIHTRRAVVVHYDPTLVGNFEYDTPCNLVLNFYILEGFLHLTIFARSIDLWYGFCNDQYCFSRLMIEMAEKLNRPIGQMHWFITNLHLYNDKL